MEIRLLSSSDERRQFALRLEENRFTKGAGFLETEESLLGTIHLRFGRLFGLFDENGAQPDRMLAGAVLHDLASFPQSFPKPDLTHLPLGSVIECGELWSGTAGGAALMRQGVWILAGLLRVKAVLIYPIAKPWNLTFPYIRDFEKVSGPIEWPYIRGLNGETILVQPMVSEGERLQRMIQDASRWGFESNKDLSEIRFKGCSPIFSGELSKVRSECSPGKRIFKGQSGKLQQQLQDPAMNDNGVKAVHSTVRDKS